MIVLFSYTSKPSCPLTGYEVFVTSTYESTEILIEADTLNETKYDSVEVISLVIPTSIFGEDKLLLSNK